jgi:hypothetical protein
MFDQQLYQHYVMPHQPQPYHHQQQSQPQQHMNINHMLSPRAPASSALNHHQFQYSRKNSSHQQDSKLNRFINMWQRNHRIDPNPPTPQSQQSSMFKISSKPMIFDRKAIESSSSVWRDSVMYESNNSPTTPRQQRKQNRASFVSNSSRSPQPFQQQQTTTVMESPKLSSWLPGLFHFKQPKVCSLECEARDEREAIGKISQVLEEVITLSVFTLHVYIIVYLIFFEKKKSIWRALSQKDKSLMVELDEKEK